MAQKKIIRISRFLVFTLLYLRLVILKARHKVLRFVKRRLGHVGHFHETGNDIRPGNDISLLRQIFSWNISDNALKIRLVLVIAGFLLCFIILSVRLVIIASTDFVESSKFLNKGDMFRRDIVDRHGNLLAVNLPAASLYAKPMKVVDPEGLAEKLVIVFPELDKAKVLELLKSNKKFVWIKRDITPKQQQDIYNLGIPGLEFEREQKRIYTYGRLLSHVIGYVGRDMEGLAGIEKYFDHLLTHRDQDLQGEREGASNLVNGNLQLSIDVRLQNILSEEIDKAVKKFEARGAGGIIVNPNNGEILALVSKPDFDPHYPGNATADELFNMVTQGAYEMGSGMKALTLAIGFDTSVISMNDAYDLSYMKVGKKLLKDAHPVKGWHSIGQIFLHSSNIGVSQIMLEIGKNNLRNYLKKLNLLEKLDIELPERARPLFPPYSRWNDLSLVTMSYGYSISESPAHFAQSLLPLVNGGIMYPMTLLKLHDKKPPIGKRVFSESTSLSMRQLMRLTVSEGTGKKAEVKGYYVGGKTGTAEKLVNGKYEKNLKMNKRMSSFFGIMPASNPKYMVYIIIDEPKGTKDTFGFAGGGWTAAPTVGAVLERLAVLYGINKLDENDPEVQELLDVDYIIDGHL